jgi:hypothetical protein
LSQPQPWYPPPPPTQKSNTTLIIVILLVVVIVVGVVGAIAAYSFVNFAARNTANLRLPHSLSLASGQIAVPANHYYYYYFTIPASSTGITVTGSFTVSGGGQIQVLVMDQSNFNNWKASYASTSYYNSGQVMSGSITASLPIGGTYDLVYSNPSTTDKNVQTTAYVYYVA